MNHKKIIQMVDILINTVSRETCTRKVDISVHTVDSGLIFYSSDACIAGYNKEEQKLYIF